MAKKTSGSTKRKTSGASKAKKPTARKKPASRKKTGNQGKNYTTLIVLVIVLLFVGVAALYYLKEFKTDSPPPVAVEERASEEATRKPDKPSAKIAQEKEESKKEQLEETSERNVDIPEPTEELDRFYYTKSFDFAWPAYSLDDQIIEHEAYALAYNEDTEQAIWVAYRLNGDLIRRGKVDRTDNFKEDPLVTTGSASLSDYSKSGYDRGHLAPAADFNWSTTAMDESFYMSNMSPQQPGFNRGIWKKLEAMIRNWAIDNRELYVVTGPIFDKKPKQIGKNKVQIPSAYYKAIIDINEPELKAIGFIMPHMKSDSDIMVFATTIDDIEKTTGLDFFPMIPDELEDKLESTLNKSLWR